MIDNKEKEKIIQWVIDSVGEIASSLRDHLPHDASEDSVADFISEKTDSRILTLMTLAFEIATKKFPESEKDGITYEELEECLFEVDSSDPIWEKLKIVKLSSKFGI